MLEKRIDASRLFSFIIRKLGHRLPSVMLNGLNTCEFRSMVLTPCIAYCAKQRVTLRYQTLANKRITFDRYWKLIQAHCQQHGAGSIILGMAGEYNHWTCVRRVTDKTILLADSQYLERLYRRYIGLNDNAKYRLGPSDTFLLTVQ